MEHFSCQTRILAGNGILPALGEFHPRRLFLVKKMRNPVYWISIPRVIKNSPPR